MNNPEEGEVTEEIESQTPNSKLDESKVSPEGNDGLELYEHVEGGPLPPTVMKELTHFRCKQDKGFVDVWWLYDSGGELIHFSYPL